MLVTVNPNQTLWEALLPEECLGMPAELVAVDRLLDDPEFFEPYRPYFSALLGRPSVPLETYLRVMFLKSRHRLSCEAVVREATDSLSWRLFCRVPLVDEGVLSADDQRPYMVEMPPVVSRVDRG